ncbi:UDP-glucose 4-epimerase [Alteripontixanthobacter maritimus]|uniref:UDP-glucose 4-epimerase n=1 Tax=Alteripontixanthobacter maritimus TaxID=2161824 RepID=A0A369QCU1_9SPHN|nr:NAD-dependent epimerase/dehydratase family protein [Alteripontixanthobacter maritimus]RDC61385.1 UDP-glucose 4-epimerase [Alteripontixanthobacter maritimus]
MLKKIVIFGAGGFVGRIMCQHMAREGHHVLGVMRNAAPTGCEFDVIVARDPGDIISQLQSYDWAINCIGRAHVLKSEPPELARKRYFDVNHHLAVQLAQAAIDAELTGFAQISSVAAVRSYSDKGTLVDDSSLPAPDRIYGASKLHADRELLALNSRKTSVVCLRPPALIGEQPAGLVGKLARAAKLGLPLPFGSIKNRRSFMAVENLADATLAALEAQATGAFIVTDSDPVSVAEIYRNLTRQAGHKYRCPSLPKPIVKMLAKIVLRGRTDSLLGDAAYDGSAFREHVGWKPPMSLEKAMVRMMASL